MLSNNNKMQICLVLALLAAGCGGGGGGSSTNVSSSPSTSNTSGNTVTDPGTGSGTTPTPGTETTPITEGPVTQTASMSAITSTWLNSDVLATMLVQQTETVSGTPTLIFPSYAALPWSGPGPTGQVDPEASTPNVYAYQNLSLQAGANNRFTYSARTFWRHDMLPGAVYNFNALTHDFDLIVRLPQFRQSSNEVFFDRSGTIATNTELLQLGNTLTTRVGTETLNGAVEGETATTLTAPSPYSIRQGVQIPFNQVLLEWRQDGTSQTVYSQLLLLNGATSDQARLCLNTHVPSIKRLACTIWAVPPRWSLGQRLEFRGNYIVDDRTPQAGETGHLYWQTPR